MKATTKLAAALSGATVAAWLTAGSALAQTSSDEAAAASAATAFGGMSLLFICCYALMILVSIALAVFSLIMYYDAAMRDRVEYPNNNKSTWILLFIFFSYWTALFYYFMIKRKAPRAA